MRVRSGASEPPAASEPPSASEQPTGWSAALEAAQARAAALRASSLGAASAAQAAAEAAVKHPLGAKVLETSGNAWSALPADFRLHAPTAAAAALAFTTVALVYRESNKGTEKLMTALQPPKCVSAASAWELSMTPPPRLDDVAFLQSELLKALDLKKDLTRRLLEAELALAEARQAAGAAAAAAARKR